MSKYYQRAELSALNTPGREAILTRVPWRAILLGAILLMSIIYLGLVNGSAAHGFEVTTLETQKKQLDVEYVKYQRELAEAQSLDRLAESSKQMGLVPVVQVEYVEAATTAALR